MDDVQQVRERLRGHNLRAIADGAGVGHSWLKMFARGAIPEPAYWRVKAITEFLGREQPRTPA